MKYEFEVAISFARSERGYARTIASIVEANGINVFLDEFFEPDLWGKNLVESLSDIYENKAKYCLRNTQKISSPFKKELILFFLNQDYAE